MVKKKANILQKGRSIIEMPYSARILRTQRIIWYIQFIWDRKQALGEVCLSPEASTQSF